MSTQSVLEKMILAAKTKTKPNPIISLAASAAESAASKGTGRKLNLRASALTQSCEILPLDKALGSLPPEGMFAVLTDAKGGLAGFLRLDMAFVDGMIEIAIGGDASPRMARSDPQSTSISGRICNPIVNNFLETFDSCLQTLENGIGIGVIKVSHLVADQNELSYVMTNTEYLCLALDFDIGDKGRGGLVSLGIALRNIAGAEKNSIADEHKKVAEGLRWQKELFKFANELEIETLGILDRFPMSLDDIRRLKLGDVIALPNARIDRIRLEFRRQEEANLLLAQGELGIAQGRKAFRYHGRKVPTQSTSPAHDDEGGESIFFDDEQS